MTDLYQLIIVYGKILIAYIILFASSSRRQRFDSNILLLIFIFWNSFFSLNKLGWFSTSRYEPTLVTNIGINLYYRYLPTLLDLELDLVLDAGVTNTNTMANNDRYCEFWYRMRERNLLAVGRRLFVFQTL